MVLENSFQPRIVTTAMIAEKIRRAKPTAALGKTIFLIGAGCSITAGVPDAQEIARRMVKEVASAFDLEFATDDHVGAYRSLVSRGKLNGPDASHTRPNAPEGSIDWYHVYDQMFERHYCTRDDTRELFDTLVEGTKGAINWAHLCLGELAARHYISTIMTTNFDQLVLSGMVRAGLLPVVCDGIESLNRIAAVPRHPQLIELHGSRHTYVLRNRPEDVKRLAEDAVAIGAIQGLMQHATTFVVIGYAGREEGIMTLLVQAAKSFNDKNLFWVQRSADPEHLSSRAKDFLSTTRNGGLLVDQDADGFFVELCRELGVGAPSAVSDPLRTAEDTMTKISASKKSNNPDIEHEIERARSTLARVRDCLERSANPTAIIDEIRDLRLRGQYKEAYQRANRALGQ